MVPTLLRHPSTLLFEMMRYEVILKSHKWNVSLYGLMMCVGLLILYGFVWLMIWKLRQVTKLFERVTRFFCHYGRKIENIFLRAFQCRCHWNHKHETSLLGCRIIMCLFFFKLLASFILCWLFVAVFTPLLFSFHLYYYYYYNCMFVFLFWTSFVLFFCLFVLVYWMFMYLVGVPSTYLSNILFTIKRKTWFLILLLLWYIYIRAYLIDNFGLVISFNFKCFFPLLIFFFFFCPPNQNKTCSCPIIFLSTQFQSC